MKYVPINKTNREIRMFQSSIVCLTTHFISLTLNLINKYTILYLHYTLSSKIAGALERQVKYIALRGTPLVLSI